MARIAQRRRGRHERREIVAIGQRQRLRGRESDAGIRQLEQRRISL